MRKCLLLVALLIVANLSKLMAQPLFEAPDTVCPKQLVTVKSNVPNASTHYWGFCSAYLLNTPVGQNTGPVQGSFTLLDPASIEIARDGDEFYAFVINRVNRNFVRFSYGNSLTNTPTIKDFGTMDDVLPYAPNSLYVVRDTTDSTWHVFVCGGDDNANSTLARIDFGKHLNTTPNIVNFGNYNGTLNKPTGLFVGMEGGKWYGYLLNKVVPESHMVRIEFDSVLSYTPQLYDLGAVSNLTDPNDLAPLYDNGLWYFYVTNGNGNFVFRLDMGPSLATAVPSSNNLGSLLGTLNVPTGISVVRDCDSLYAYIVNAGNHSLVRMGMPTATGPYVGIPYGNVAGFKYPSALSSFVRDRDNVFAYASNIDSLSRIVIAQCTNASITYSTTNKPLPFSYDKEGTYNIYYAINEGQPNMRVMCKLITVLPVPSMFMSNDTVLCQGDSAYLHIFSANALSYTWSPNRNISNTNQAAVKVWPDYSQNYHITMPFAHNCIIDTVIKIDVRKLKADAGPDRIVNDGASTILGGPYTSIGERSRYLYTWSPDQFLDDPYSVNPVARPTHDMTYYLYVQDTSNTPIGHCVSIDTVVVHVTCNDLNLPNAFIPGASGTTGHFGLANSQIVKLNYFRIFNRWGMKVFDAGNNPSKEWDGMIDGTIAPFGVYVWEADGFCNSGQRFNKSGNVTVIK